MGRGASCSAGTDGRAANRRADSGRSSLCLGNYREADQELRRQRGDVILRKARYFAVGNTM